MAWLSIPLGRDGATRYVMFGPCHREPLVTEEADSGKVPFPHYEARAAQITWGVLRVAVLLARKIVRRVRADLLAARTSLKRNGRQPNLDGVSGPGNGPAVPSPTRSDSHDRAGRADGRSRDIVARRSLPQGGRSRPGRAGLPGRPADGPGLRAGLVPAGSHLPGDRTGRGGDCVVPGGDPASSGPCADLEPVGRGPRRAGAGGGGGVLLPSRVAAPAGPCRGRPEP